MATIPSGTKFLGVDPALTNLTEKKGSRLDSKTEYFSIEDIQAAAGSSGSSILKAVQVNITEAEILNSAGFTKQLVSSVSGKVMVPVSIVAYRKTGGTAYSIANSIRLNTVLGSSSSSLGSGTVDAIFTNSQQQSQVAIFSTTNTLLASGNSLSLASGVFSSPSAITGGTGDLIVCLSYIEISTT